MSDSGNGGLSIIGLILLGVLIWFVIKKFWLVVFIVAGLLVVGIIAMIFLVKSSKEAKGEHDSVKDEIKAMLSKIRKQKFKAQNTIQRLKEWGNDAIFTTYSDLFGNKYTKSELLENYAKIKQEYAGKLDSSQVAKCDGIVGNYLNLLKTEEKKIKTLEKLEAEYGELYEKLKTAQRRESQSRKLDKHYQKLEALGSDTQGDAVIYQSELSMDDLKKEIEYKQEYIRQLEELTDKYSLQPGSTMTGYTDDIDQILQKLDNE